MPSFRDSLPSELSYLYEEALEAVDDFESHLVPGDLSAKEVLRAHFCIADYFIKEGEGIGGFGPKNVDLLLSALSRQHVSLGGVPKWSTPHDKAATLMFGLVKNHPFHDANKRTAYLSSIHYLVRSGYTITIPEKALEDMTVRVANNELKQFPRFRDLSKKHPHDAEVLFLSHYLRQNTRKTDRNQYHVTYRELNKILSRYGVRLDNPHNNQIDVLRNEDRMVRQSLFGRSQIVTEPTRVCTLGFPGWTKVVGKGRLKHVREQLGLMPANGIDSQAFFKDVDDMQVLVEIYEGALRRLADR